MRNRTITHSLIIMIDARPLTMRAADKIVRRFGVPRPFEFGNCGAEIQNDEGTDSALDAIKIGQRSPSTYLRFVDQDGFVTTHAYRSSGDESEDEVCEKYRKRLPRSVRKSAVCITGTALQSKRF